MRIIHTMLRVKDLTASIAFYTEVLGMTVLRQQDYPDGKFTLAFLGHGPEAETAVIELTYNWDIDHYELGTGFGHIAIEVADIYRVCDTIATKGGKIVRQPGPMKHGTTVIAFVRRLPRRA